MSSATVEIAILTPAKIITIAITTIATFLKDIYHIFTTFLIISIALPFFISFPPAVSVKKLASNIGILLKNKSSIV